MPFTLTTRLSRVFLFLRAVTRELYGHLWFFYPVFALIREL